MRLPGQTASITGARSGTGAAGVQACAAGCASLVPAGIDVGHASGASGVTGRAASNGARTVGIQTGGCQQAQADGMVDPELEAFGGWKYPA